MHYFGGKARVGKHIANIINTYITDDHITFISPFVGGGWVETQIKSNNKYLYDKHMYLIAMYRALQNGWLPPKSISQDDYNYIKTHRDEKPHLTGFVGFGCSYSGKWFGGYAKDKTKRNYCLNAYNSILKKMKNLYDAKFQCCDYQELNPKGAVIYCDPPYKGTTQYDKSLVGEFNTNEFWELMRQWSKSNKVFISEYEAPSDFQCIWEMETKLDIRDKNNIKQKRVEKLFTYKNE